MRAYARLIWSLCKDPRTPKSFKFGVLALILYLLIPADVISDFIPILGQIDDAIVIVMGIRWLIRLCPPYLVKEHQHRAN